jgi:hypothetical protein
MGDKEALALFVQGKRLDQATVKRLWQKGYIEVGDATNMQSPGQELVPISITPRGKRVLEER